MTKRVRSIVIDSCILAALYAAAFWAMAQFRVMEVLLAPGGASTRIACFFAVGFLLLRAFVILAGPGWILARLALASPTIQAPHDKSSIRGQAPN